MRKVTLTLPEEVYEAIKEDGISKYFWLGIEKARPDLLKYRRKRGAQKGNRNNPKGNPKLRTKDNED